MPFYLRKSVRLGPLRFNLSKSGVGISAGIRGLRVGTGPRGNYVHMGRHGIYYRASLPSTSSKGTARIPQPAAPLGVRPDEAESACLTEIESTDISEIRDTNSEELLQEFDRKHKALRFSPLAFGATGVAILLALFNSAPPWAVIAIALVGSTLSLAARYRDTMTRTVVLLYDLDPDVQAVYERLHRGFDELSACSRSWHIAAKGDVSDWKRSAGATSQVKRSITSLTASSPPQVRTNIPVPAIAVGRQTLYLFPDRVLVIDSNGVGAVAYADLSLERLEQRFIEEEAVPADAQVVDHTWKYVNKKGGPDRRFRDNREVPIALYEALHFTSASGLNELIHVSRAGAGRQFEEAIAELQQLRTDPMNEKS